MWQCLTQASGDGYWQRVRSLAAAAGYVSGVDDLDPQFQKLVAERVAAGDPEREDSPAYLLKRLKQQKSWPPSSSTGRALQTFRRSVLRRSTGLAR
jgi:hypothetical protein